MNRKHLLSRKVVLVAALGLVALTPLYASAANKLIVKDAAGSVDQFVVSDTGFIGVGLGTDVIPAAALTVKGASALGDANPVSSQMRLWDVGNAGSTGGAGYVGLHNQPGGGGVMPLNGDRLGYFLFGTVSQTTGMLGGAGLTARAIGNNWRDIGDPQGQSIPGGFALETANVTGGRAPRLVVAPNGNISIGGGYSNTTTLEWALAPQKLEVIGGVKISNQKPDRSQSASDPVKPACNATDGPTTRGTFWYTIGATGTTDKIDICFYDGSNYNWRAVTLGPPQ